jgi:hypothetical protein
MFIHGCLTALRSRHRWSVVLMAGDFEAELDLRHRLRKKLGQDGVWSVLMSVFIE